MRDYSKVCCARKLCVSKIETSTRSSEISHDFIDSALDSPLARRPVLSCELVQLSSWPKAPAAEFWAALLTRLARFLANVKVTLVNEATGAPRETVTNDSGDYGFVEVPPGSLPGGV